MIQTSVMGERRRRRRGQALLELAIASPLLVVLLVGGAQVGSIVYGQIAVGTAADTGARIAASQPDNSLSWVGTQTGLVTHTCLQSDTYAACVAAFNALGGLAKSSATVTISDHVVLSDLLRPQPRAALASTRASSAKTGNSATAVLSAASVGQCASTSTASYATVTVSYPMPVFVPIINQIFETSSGIHTVRTSVTMRIQPCTTTDGQ